MLMMKLGFVIEVRHLEFVDADFLFEAVDFDEEIFILMFENAERILSTLRMTI